MGRIILSVGQITGLRGYCFSKGLVIIFGIEPESAIRKVCESWHFLSFPRLLVPEEFAFEPADQRRRRRRRRNQRSGTRLRLNAPLHAK